MMGHEYRLAVTFRIAVMQTRAVIRAAINVPKRHPEVEHGSRDYDPPGGRGEEAEYVKTSWSRPLTRLAPPVWR